MSKVICSASMLKQGIHEIIQRGGIAYMDGIIVSDQQRDYADRWADTIIRSSTRASDGDMRPSVTLLGADTGTGKTIAFGVPLLVYAALGAKVGIATHTHALQRQYLGSPSDPGDLEKICNWLEAAGYKRLKIARRVGKQAFISHKAAVETVMHIEFNGNPFRIDVDVLDDIVDFALRSNKGKNTGMLDDLKETLGGNLPRGINASSICLMGHSPASDCVAYQKHLELVADADVVLFSHAYLLASAVFRQSKLIEGDLDALVIDEADTLESQANGAFKFETSLSRLSGGLAQITGDEGEAVRATLSDITQLCAEAYEGQPSQALQDLPSSLSKRLVTLCLKASNELFALAALKTQALKTLKVGDEITMLQDAIAELTDAGGVLERFTAAADKVDTALVGTTVGKTFYAAALSYSPTRHYPSLAIMPLYPAMLVSKIWDYVPAKNETCVDRQPVKSVLLTSATFAGDNKFVGGSDFIPFLHSAHAINIRTKENKRHVAETDLWAAFEPIKFGAVKYILADPSMPSPVRSVEDDETVLDERWLTYAARMICAAREAGGRTLVLLNSYSDVNAFAKRLNDFGITALMQQRGQSISDMQPAFLSDKKAVWLSPTAWAGLNLPGAIANLVIPRLPFKMTDSLTRALMCSEGKLLNKDVNNILAARSISQAKAQFRQGIGRPIRRASDKARIWIGDPRFPLHRKSPIPMLHPSKIYNSGVKRHEHMHECIPVRFENALVMAEVLLESGDIIGVKRRVSV